MTVKTYLDLEKNVKFSEELLNDIQCWINYNSDVLEGRKGFVRKNAIEVEKVLKEEESFVLGVDYRMRYIETDNPKKEKVVFGLILILKYHLKDKLYVESEDFNKVNETSFVRMGMKDSWGAVEKEIKKVFGYTIEKYIGFFRGEKKEEYRVTIQKEKVNKKEAKKIVKVVIKYYKDYMLLLEKRIKHYKEGALRSESDVALLKREMAFLKNQCECVILKNLKQQGYEEEVIVAEYMIKGIEKKVEELTKMLIEEKEMEKIS